MILLIELQSVKKREHLISGIRLCSDWLKGKQPSPSFHHNGRCPPPVLAIGPRVQVDTRFIL